MAAIGGIGAKLRWCGERVAVSHRRLRRRLGRVTVFFLEFVIVFMIAFALWAYCQPAPETIVVLSGRTEKLAMRVLNPSEAAIDIDGMRLTSLDFGGAAESLCVAGTLLPNAAAVVTYRRAGWDGPLIIEVTDPQSAGLLATGDGNRELPPSVSLAADPGCPGASPTRLPVWGAIDVGDNLRAIGRSGDNRSFVLLSGKLNVYARSVRGLWLTPSLYFVRSIELPVGSRITTGPLDSNRSDPAWGLLSIDRKEAFNLSLSTQTHDLTVFVPGSNPEPDRIEVTDFVQIFEDPNLIAIQILIAILMGVLTFSSFMIEIFSPLDKERHRAIH